jgi:cyanophycinase
MGPRRTAGSLALVGGGEWEPAARDFDAELLARSGAKEVVVLPTAAEYFGALGATTRTLDVLHRTEAEDPEVAATIRKATFVYLADGSPLHLRSVLKGSALFDALLAAYHGGGVLAASGAGATLLCDPMVDPRGGAYTVGLGVVKNLAVFPYHGTAAGHLRERSVDLLPRSAVLAGIDEQTALVKDADGWSVAGAGTVTIYGAAGTTEYRAGDAPEGLPT